jgi:hypothetical protein
MTIRATHVPEGASGQPKGPPPVRYATTPMWPGYTAGRTACCQCTWAPLRGVWQVKALHAGCPEMPAHKAAGR